MKKAIVLGATGMVGGCFLTRLIESGWDVLGVSRNTAMGRQIVQRSYRFVGCDILDRQSLQKLFSKEKPDLIVNMAAQAFNGTSWEAEHYTYLVNIEGTHNVLAAAHDSCPEAKLLLACSSAEYGDVKPEDCPLVEDMPLKPITPYGVTKVASECMGYQFFKNYNMPIYLPRMFIHVGTGHPPATAIQNFARQIALIKTKRIKPVMQTGRLDTARDFIDVRDGVDGMLTLLEKGIPGTPVNICTGVAPTIQEVLDMLLDIAGVDVEIQQSKSLLRHSDEPLLLGDNSRLKALGWERKYSLRETLEGVLDDWIRRVEKEPG
ncbi:MAG: NAD-dependent epimerase/dehydratase family protein [Lentisphaerae bacterium]|jgi:GDP-4-dehydro-6-deoxy-D-mannose reductase|nr:NAD-dependent epimerase/dehydratase family protein [Lentisphaerota bacterium]